MKKIRIHRYNNEKWGRAHLPFFKRFDEYLSQFFDVESINYNEDGETFNGNINTIQQVSRFGYNPPLSDVDCVIENLQSGELKVLSFSEYFSNFVTHYAKSKSCTTVLLAHFNWHNLYYWMKRENSVSEISKVRPWIFLPYEEFDYHLYRNKRDNCQTLNEKMYWQGSGVDDYRQCVRLLEQDGYLQPITPMNHDVYLDKMSSSKIGMSYYQTLNRYRTPFDYPGEFCYREIEYMSIGLPFIRIEYKDSVHDPLLANVHYISIPRDVANIEFEKNGERGVANLYIQRYNEVINDNEFLNYISKNQKEWFDRNILSPNREKLTFDLLGLDEWLDANNKIVESPQAEKIDTTKLFEDFLVFLKQKNNLSIPEQIPQTNVSEENNNVVKSFDVNSYKNYVLQQSVNVFDVFKNFIKNVRPKRILEIGTAGGGFTLFLRDCLNEIGLTDSKIRSFEVIDQNFYENLRNQNIEIIIDNIFSKDYSEITKPELINDFINDDGTTVVLCDGGSKVDEFNLISKLLKPGDYILAHDYCRDKEHFDNEINNKIWSWCEIMESNIEKCSTDENLVPISPIEFNNVVWVCKQKENVVKEGGVLSDDKFKEICKKINNCHFIQVGANNGKSTDPIHDLIKENNWTGVLVEPGFEAFEELVQNYKGYDGLSFEMSAISDVDGEVTLYCGTTTPHFTMDFEKAKWMFCIDPIARKVNGLTMSSLIEKYQLNKIDLLQIDTEGYDYIILKTFPFDKFKPKVIRYEYVCLKDKVQESINFIQSNGYKTYFSEDGADIIAIL